MDDLYLLQEAMWTAVELMKDYHKDIAGRIFNDSIADKRAARKHLRELIKQLRVVDRDLQTTINAAREGLWLLRR